MIQSLQEIESSDETVHSDQEQPPYHILSKSQKWRLVILVSFAGALSPLSNYIYLPVIQTVSHDLGVSATLVALTIAVYMIVQGVAPSLFGSLSDTCGRRLCLTLSLLVYAAANIALAFTVNCPMLLVLRCVQAAGSAATFSISAAVIVDIACLDERDGFMRTSAGVRSMGQVFGPVIGGILNNVWGFRSTFWLLFILGAIVLVALLVILPETERSRVGNGSIPLTGFDKPFAYIISPPKAWPQESSPVQVQNRQKNGVGGTLKEAFRPLTFLCDKDVATLLAWGAVAYTAWSMVTSSTTTALLGGYPFLNEWQIGLCFLPNGFGCILGSLCTGWLLDRSLKLAEDRYKDEHGLSPGTKVTHMRDFPLVKTRLQLIPYFNAALIISLVLYGPSFEFNDSHRYQGPILIAPLVLQFFIAFSATAIFNINSTLLVDCFHDYPASATMLINLCRCLLGAAGVSTIQPLIDALDMMKAFLIVTATVIVCTPLIWVQWSWGEKWRREREDARQAAGLAL